MFKPSTTVTRFPRKIRKKTEFRGFKQNEQREKNENRTRKIVLKQRKSESIKSSIRLSTTNRISELQML
ncbi:hypothetical protein AAC387_Pa01g1092 [Persea americana]